MNPVLNTVDGVEITERQARIYARRFHVNYDDETQVPGVVGALTAWVDKSANEQGDSFLLESPETREEFKAIREAHDMRASGKVKPESEFSKVSILEVIPDWEEFKKTLPANEAVA